ncbi:MAG: SpoIIE family protein phosphatase, partial [Candidatus Kapabacteria bacterium]|nr:SpoIIE family protein phosphatase [Candidatus Kapabacteria bacterium]
KTLQDSVFSMDKQKEFANLDAKRENDIKDKEIVILQTEKKAQQFQSYLLGGGVIVLFGAFGLAFIRFREKKKLSDKLAFQKSEIETQKSIVEEKNEQITASITYASTIQNAILPWKRTLENAFFEILIFYKPKDIISGDSYWFQEVDGIKFLAVIDCTGHGIPGAMLTVIAATALDDAVLGKRLSDTGQILTYMNEKVTEVLNQRLVENKIRDGMEVALIAIHQDKVQFSGAGRPLYMKNGTMEIIKTDKRGIAGQTENDIYQFTSINIEKSENLIIYLTSDGFADQMNEYSKKYSTKKFVALLDSISEKSISEQHEILENEFNSHKGTRSQIDDVTILGVRI